MVEGIELLFPQLQDAEWGVTSKPDDVYNCIAWAANVTTDWWWPVGPGRTYWPEGVRREATLDAFRELFTTLGYEVCADEKLEPGFEKIAIFADDQGFPTHAARQLASGRWTSKLGKLEDIEHDLPALAGVEYGSIAIVMSRATIQSQTLG